MQQRAYRKKPAEKVKQAEREAWPDGGMKDHGARNGKQILSERFAS